MIILYLFNITFIILEAFMPFQFNEVAHSKDAVIEFYNPDNSQQCIMEGNLEIFIQSTLGMLLFKIGNFQYGVNPNDQVIYENKDPKFKLVLCFHNQQKCWIAKIRDNAQLVLVILTQRCKVIERKMSRIIIKQIKEKSFGKPIEEIQQKQVSSHQGKMNGDVKLQQSPQSTSLLLIETSKSLSKVLAKAGQLLSKGFIKLGNFLSKRVEPSEQIVLSEETKKLLKESAQGSKKILQITTQQFIVLFRFAKKQAQKLVQKAEQTERGKQLTKKEEFNSYKKKILTGLHVLGNISEGIGEGFSKAMNGLTKGTAQVVGAKYGKDAGQATQNIMDGARNINQILDVPYNVAKRQFKPTEAVIKKL